MSGKSRIVDELGEKALLLPNLVNEALLANDRAKYLLTLLQAARTRADHPDGRFSDLKQERMACDLEEAEFDTVVEQSRKEGPGEYHIPGCRRTHNRLIDEVRRMLAPLQADDRDAAAQYEERLETLLHEAPDLTDDRVSGEYLDRVAAGPTGAQERTADSLHLLIMALHKELNRLQERVAGESIDGARVYGLQARDRSLVAAFMAGVNRTRWLKFDHPGLGTTATRAGKKLIIQNDIGTTDAHVLVVHVERLTATVTHTDVHLQRLLFFQGLFDRFAMRWADTQSKRAAGLAEGVYHLCQGICTAGTRPELEEFLTCLGSRLVFLIDWNRARKRLRKFAPRGVCLGVLRWAADHDCGQRGFLQLGGEELIYAALQLAGRIPLQPGRQLSDLLGPQRTAEFLKFTLRTAAEGLRAGHSEFLIRDEVTAELRHYIETAHQGMLEIAGEHASLLVELAMAARDSLLAVGGRLSSGIEDKRYPSSPPNAEGFLQRTARQAKRWEHRADELVNQGRAARLHGPNTQAIPELIRIADDVADELEEAVFLVTLLPGEGAGAAPFLALQELAGLLVLGAQEYLKAVENARQVHRASSREQVQDFLEAVDRTVTVEHRTDDAHRRARAGVLTFAGDFKQLHLFAGIADHLEAAADALMRSALLLRDYILGEVLTR